MKTTEELNALKEEVKTLNKKLSELSEQELQFVAGGISGNVDTDKCYEDYPAIMKKAHK